jgi:hypothetical protein
VLANRRFAVVVALVAVSGAAIALGVQVCPIDKSNMQWTGATRIEMGKTLAEYKCIHGHVYWIPVN